MDNAVLTRNGLGPLDQSRIPRPDNTLFPPEQQHVTQHSHFDATHERQAQVPAFAAYEQEHEQNGALSVPLQYMGVARSPKKRTPRTTMVWNNNPMSPRSGWKLTSVQACDACRAAKAKCTDLKPCQGCADKRIECKFPEPAQKP